MSERLASVERDRSERGDGRAPRILVAMDGSPAARTALELVRGLAWPAGTALRLVHVAPRFAEALRDSLLETAERLRSAQLTVETDVLGGGEPADRIVRDAGEFQADLIVAGHRGHGAIATLLLGSVAAGIVERAACPVLIARLPSCARVVLAEDGSPAAFEARRVLATWPVFLGMPMRVVSVANVKGVPLLSEIAPAILEDARRERDELLVEAREAYDRLATESAEQLRIAGRRAEAEIRSGDVASEILASAREMDADLIAMGSRGRGPLTRLVLGSAARDVLTRATCSVLVTHAGAG